MKRRLVLKLTAIAIGVFLSLLAAEVILRVQTVVQLDNFSPFYARNHLLHHGTDEFVVTEYGSSCDGQKTKLLLIGDSWMENADLSRNLSRTIEREFAKKAGSCVQAINGGTGSYAPTLYMLKARQAFERYGKFDYIIVNIDETDVGDEWQRYRIPTVRDTSGKIVAVPYENDLASQYIRNAQIWAQDSNFYIIRFLKFVNYYKILVPSIYRPTFFPEYTSIMQYVFAPDAASIYKREHQHFESRLLEMATEITSFTSDANHVYVTHHPHLRGLVSSIKSGTLYLPIVSTAIAGLKEKTGVLVLDAREHIKEIHGQAFPKNTYLENDPFSHLTGGGEIRYGKWIVSQIDLK